MIPFPTWDDLVRLAFNEICFYGATSVQVMRRMNALVADLTKAVPEERRGPSNTGAGDCRPPSRVRSPTVKRDWTPRRKTGKDSAYPAKILPRNSRRSPQAVADSSIVSAVCQARHLARNLYSAFSATAITELRGPVNPVLQRRLGPT